MKQEYDVIVVSGGPADLAAVLSARQNGTENVPLLERQADPGGTLNQCTHNGFGLHYSKQELTDPEYAERFINELKKNNVEVLTGAMVLELDSSKRRTVYAINPQRGYLKLQAKAIVLTMDYRERTRGAIGVPGSRPAGVFTAGAVQLYMDLEGDRVGNRVVILDPGDIGLTMARRLTLKGAKVLDVYKVVPYSSGLMRNVVRYLNDYDIPPHLSHTITEIRGDERVEQVVVQKADENRVPIPGTKKVPSCGIVLPSVGLTPEDELSCQAELEIDPHTSDPVAYENMEASTPGIFAYGNVAHVHDLVNFVTAESQRANRSAALYSKSSSPPEESMLRLKSGFGVGYAAPQKIRPQSVEKSVDVFFRANRISRDARVVVKSGETHITSCPHKHIAPGRTEKITLPPALLKEAENGELTVSIEKEEWRVTGLVCIACPKGCRLYVDERNGYKITGNSCPKEEVYGKKELTIPTRTVTSTVKIRGASIARVPVKTDHEIPKKNIFIAIHLLDGITLQAPVHMGDVVVPNLLGPGVNFAVTHSPAKTSSAG